MFYATQDLTDGRRDFAVLHVFCRATDRDGWVVAEPAETRSGWLFEPGEGSRSAVTGAEARDRARHGEFHGYDIHDAPGRALPRWMERATAGDGTMSPQPGDGRVMSYFTNMPL